MATTVEGDCLGTVADFHRAGHGFNGLRKRYIRRAEMLTRHSPFLESMELFRERWNELQPDCPLPVYTSDELGYMPRAVIDKFLENERRRARLSAILHQMEVSGAPETEQQPVRREFLDFLRAFPATPRNWWIDESERLVLKWFPAEDFPNPYPNRSHPTQGPDISFYRTSHPALMFISVAMQTDARLINDLDPLFEPMVLEPIDLFPYLPRPEKCVDDDDICWDEEPEIETDADLQWYLPLYPGITVKDLCDAAPSIVTRVNEIYETRTATARVIALRESGITLSAIADRLGLTEPTVRSILKQSENAAA